jgi:hypothetical protein
MAREFPSVLDLVGGTPIVRLDRISRDVPGEILAKLEFLNPGGSVKDRIGLLDDRGRQSAPDRSARAGRSSNRHRATPVSG